MYCVFEEDFQVGFRSRIMPHLGQSPGVADSTPGHIGQKNFAPDEGWIASEESCSWPPQQDLAFTGSGSGSGRGEGLRRGLIRPLLFQFGDIFCRICFEFLDARITAQTNIGSFVVQDDGVAHVPQLFTGNDTGA